MALLCNPYIPQELLDEIVHHISNDNRSLKACRLASRCFTEQCQRKLFRRLTLSLDKAPFDDGEYDGVDVVGRGNEEYFQRALLTLSSQFEYVEDFRLSVLPCTSALLAIVDKLINLRQLTLDFKACLKVDEALVSYCCRLPIVHLQIENALKFPAEYLRSCTSLRQFSFHSSSLSTCAPIEPDYQGNSGPPPVAFESLFLAEVSRDFTDVSLVETSHHPISLRNLRALGAAIYAESQLEPLKDILTLVAGSLDSFAIDTSKLFPPYSIDQQEFAIDLSILPRLRCIAFSTLHPDRRRRLVFVLNTLATASTSNNVEVLHILSYIPLGALSSFLRDHHELLVDLGRILSDSKFDKLQNVHFTFYTAERCLNQKYLVFAIHEAMQKIKERMSIHISISDEIWRRLRNLLLQEETWGQIFQEL
ncbi:hypothetical protein AX16_010761 [Volvariella volvacea WC 439]|nr:hypothetical protein AX16_010761 [Volvariella volvacea WC 439]